MRDGAEEARALVARALAAGADFAREAWRDAGLVLGLSTVAGAVVFVADHADLPRDLAHDLRVAGWLGLALVFAPKLGALYRAALGGAALRELGPGGLQWTRMEWRLLGTAVSLGAFSLLAFAPLLATGVAALALLRPLGAVSLGPLGTLGIGFLLLAPLLATGAALVFTGLARLGLTLPAEAAEPQPRFARGWFLTEGHGLAAAGVGAMAFALPTVALLALQAALDWLQAGAADGFGGGHGWPLIDAAVAGLVTAALASFIAAPFCVGAFAAFYRALVPEPAAFPALARGADPFAPGADAEPVPAVAHIASPRLEPVLEEEPAEPEPVTTPPEPAEAAGPAEIEAPEARPIRARRSHLRLVHSAGADDPRAETLAPADAAREAGAALAAESQEPFGP